LPAWSHYIQPCLANLPTTPWTVTPAQPLIPATGHYSSMYQWFFPWFSFLFT
jgi:hypothetical protein